MSSIRIKSPAHRAGDRPWLSLWRVPTRYLSLPQTVEQLPAPIPFAGLGAHVSLVPSRSWAGLWSHKDSSTRVSSPCLHQWLLKQGGGSFSSSLKGGVSVSSDWPVLQYQMLFENQCSFVPSSSLSPLSPWPRHGAELQALQHLGMADNRPRSQRAKVWSRLRSRHRENHLL